MEEKHSDATPNAGKKPRAPQRKLTDADRAALIELFKRPDLRKPDGSLDIATIAKLSGASYNQVIAVAAKNPYFHAQVAEADPSKMVPTEADLIDPPPGAGVVISQEDFDRMRAIFRQQQKMQAKDWVGLSLDEEMAARAEKLGKLGAAPLLPTMQFVNGGLIKGVLFLEKTLEEDADRITKAALPRETDKEGAPVEDGKVQRDWRYCWYAGYKVLLEVQKSLSQNQATLAKAARDLKALQGDKPREEKGVFEMQAPTRRAAE